MASPVVIVLTFALCFLSANCTPLQKRQASLTDLTAYIQRVKTAIFVVNTIQAGDASMCYSSTLVDDLNTEGLDGEYAKTLL